MLPLLLPFRAEAIWSADNRVVVDGIQVFGRGRAALYHTWRGGTETKHSEANWDGVDSWVLNEAGDGEVSEAILGTPLLVGSVLVRSRGPTSDLLRLYLPANLGLAYAGGLWSDLLDRTPRVGVVGPSDHLGSSCVDLIIETTLSSPPAEHGYLAPVLVSFDMERSLIALETRQYYRVAGPGESVDDEVGLWEFEGVRYAPSFAWSVDSVARTPSGIWIPLSGALKSPTDPPIQIAVDDATASVASIGADIWLEIDPPPATLIVDMVDRKNAYVDLDRQTLQLDEVRFEQMVRSAILEASTGSGLVRSEFPYAFETSGCGPSALMLLLLVHGRSTSRTSRS